MKRPPTDDVERLKKQLELCATSVAHDLRNYLQLILCRIETIESSMTDSNESIISELVVMKNMIESMGIVLRFLILPTELTDDPMVDILEQIAEYTKSMNDIEIRFHADKVTRRLRVYGGHFLPMVFGNLFMNSAKHGGEDVKVDVYVSQVDDDAEILITDNGPGIPEELRERLFERNKLSEGKGLGLHLAKSILDAHEGSIELIESDRFSGATFRILLPLKT